MSDDSPVQLRNVALVREQRIRIRDLSGFQRKNHTVPSEVNERTQAFVGRLGLPEISEELDRRFADFRQHLGFRRVDLKVTEPDAGFGAIHTPWFEFRATIHQAEDDPSECIWRRQAGGFSGPEPLLSEPFAAAFASDFDIVELEPPDSIDVEAFIDHLEDGNHDELSIEYDRTATWCQLTTDRIPGLLLVEADRVALKNLQPDLPARLLQAFFSFRDELPALPWV